MLKGGWTFFQLFCKYYINKNVILSSTKSTNIMTPKHLVNFVKNKHDMYRLKCWLPPKVYIWIQMATKTQEPDYSAEKPNTILEINISLNRHLSALGCVNRILTFVSSRWLLSFIIIYLSYIIIGMIVLHVRQFKNSCPVICLWTITTQGVNNQWLQYFYL